MKMEKNFKIDDVLYLKRNDESLHLAILISLNSKAEVKRQEKPSSLKQSHDRKECEVVIGWAHWDRR